MKRLVWAFLISFVLTFTVITYAQTPQPCYSSLDYAQLSYTQSTQLLDGEAYVNCSNPQPNYGNDCKKMRFRLRLYQEDDNWPGTYNLVFNTDWLTGNKPSCGAVDNPWAQVPNVHDTFGPGNYRACWEGYIAVGDPPQLGGQVWYLTLNFTISPY